ncbi:MAG TPA: hypothetical protein VE288_14665 [Rubrobacteraceae bacterium]|nr:hypothetical protein [Rubrobacteraceae bacterium]
MQGNGIIYTATRSIYIPNYKTTNADVGAGLGPVVVAILAVARFLG